MPNDGEGGVNLKEGVAELTALVNDPLGDWEGPADRAQRITETARWVSAQAEKEARDGMELGEICWATVRSVKWVSGLLRYRHVRFLGLVRGRVFLGLVLGSKEPSAEVPYMLVRGTVEETALRIGRALYGDHYEARRCAERVLPILKGER